jgi:hypothetical protein
MIKCLTRFSSEGHDYIMLFMVVLIVGFIALSLNPFPSYAGEVGREVPLKEALSNLSASDAEWRREDVEFRSKRQKAAWTNTEAEEYAEFVASLHRKMLEDCQIVRNIGGEDALKDFDCAIPKRKPGSMVASLPKHTTAKTEKEKSSSLDGKLKRLEAELDDTFLQVQQKYRKSTPIQSSKKNGAPNNGGDRNGNAKTGDKGKGSDQSGEEQIPKQKGGSASNAKKKGRGVTVPGKSGSSSGPDKGYDPGAGPGGERREERAIAKGNIEEIGSNDDIVARQLREAAERETDPVLKKKLIAEYKKYIASKK